VLLAPGDRFIIQAPAAFDGTARGLAVTLVGRTEQA